MSARGVIRALPLLGLLAVLGAGGEAWAEVGEIRIGRQYGIAYLPLMIMEHDRLIEKRAGANGPDAVAVRYVQLGGPAAMNDALLSGSLDYISVGAPALAKLWDKTRGSPREIRGVCSISAMPMVLNTRDPSVRSIRDLTGANKIAMNAAKISIYAMLLQMAAAREFGFAQRERLDALTVTLPHPDAMQALISGQGEIDSHFTTLPYSDEELSRPGVHTILDSRDIVGEHGSITLLISSRRFREANPRAFGAVLAAFRDAIEIIHGDRPRAAGIYLAMSKSKEPLAEVIALIGDPKVSFDMAPKGVGKYTDFMVEAKAIASRPESWKDLFFSDVHDLAGD